MRERIMSLWTSDPIVKGYVQRSALSHLRKLTCYMRERAVVHSLYAIRSCMLGFEELWNYTGITAFSTIGFDDHIEVVTLRSFM